MAIKVNEILIKATIVDNKDGAAAPSTSSAKGALQQEEKRLLVAECVEQVMEILQRKNER